MILGAQQKIALWLLSLFSIFIIGMWISQVRQRIATPFSEPKDISENNKSANQAQPFDYNQPQENEMRTKDTDGDGLTDWDELNVYNTSPYIEDSDSDGHLDGQEVKANNNPNCPIGQNCSGATSFDSANTQQISNPTVSTPLAPTSPTSEINLKDIDLSNLDLSDFDLDTLQELQNSDQIDLDNLNNLNVADIQKVLGGNSDADTLRNMLKDVGIASGLLDQISDDDLMDVYKDIINK